MQPLQFICRFQKVDNYAVFLERPETTRNQQMHVNTVVYLIHFPFDEYTYIYIYARGLRFTEGSLSRIV